MQARDVEEVEQSAVLRGRRICHLISASYPMGGSQYNTFYSLQHQQQANEVELLVGEEGPLADVCRRSNIPVRVIPFANTFFDPLGDIRAFVALLKHVRRWKPDVVHTHQSKAGILGRVAAWLAGVPVVVHTVHMPSFQSRHARPIRLGVVWAERLCARLTDRIVAVAESNRQEMINHRICAPSDICTIVSGIDFRRFSAMDEPTRSAIRAELDIALDDVVVVSVGHLTARKGHDLLITAAELVHAQAPSAKFLIVGTGPLEGELNDEIDRRHLGTVMRLCGERNDVPELLAASDIFVQTSWHEGLSRSLVEAVFTRLPAVATNVNATSEVVLDGETGFLVPPGDAAAIADRLLYLIQHSEERETMGERAFRAVAETRTVEAMVRALDELYLELLSAKRPNKVPEGHLPLSHAREVTD